MTHSALAMAFSRMLTQGASRTARPSTPRRCQLVDPSGVVGGSKQEAISIAGSTPMEMETGSGWFIPSAYSAIAADVAAARLQEYRQLVLPLNAQAVDGHIQKPVCGCVA